MASYTLAWNKTSNYEGPKQWSNRVADRGGETYAGVSRLKHPDCPIWVIIDEAKKSADFPHNLKDNKELDIAVQGLYYHEYWKPFASLTNQHLAEVLFDTAVNCGVWQTICFIQFTLNWMDDRAKDVLRVDGQLGPVTRGELMAVDANPEEADMLIFGVKVARANLYYELIGKHPEQMENRSGWFKRIATL